MSGGGGDSYKETPEQRELARIAKDQWQHYVENYVPQEKRYMELVDNMDTAGARENLAAKVSAGSADQYQAVNQQATQQMTARGINPASGQYQKGVGNAYADLSKATGEAQQQAQINFGNRKIGHTQNVVNIGQGQATNSISGINQIAQQSQAKNLNDAQMNFQRDQATQNMVGTGVGMGVSAWMNSAKTAPSTNQGVE